MGISLVSFSIAEIYLFVKLGRVEMNGFQILRLDSLQDLRLSMN